ncbi:MAG: GNAT family N-acetyltransferase [Thermodesulfobacteriota bacterium]
MTVRLVLRDARRSPADRTWLTNVYPLYLHDLSAFDDGYYELDERGTWQPDHLPSWLDEADDLPLVIVAENRRVGFALVNQAPSPHVARACDYRMSEFFVLARERGAGIGTRAAHAVFDLLPGVWEVSELPRNERAIRFWRRVIGDYARGRYVERCTDEEVRQEFRARPALRRRAR